jgi:8-oxo-dGTP pyrophosphatase MutT (NUDIX family)
MRYVGLDIKQGHILNGSSVTVTLLCKELSRGPLVYLAIKKQDIHIGEGVVLTESRTWNGYGGKWKSSDQTIRHTASRELLEEAGVRVKEGNLNLVADIEFFLAENTSGVRDMEVFFFTSEIYSGDPKETREMGPPTLFAASKIPYDDMMPVDRLILPHILNGNAVTGKVYFEKKKGQNVVKSSSLVTFPLYC